MPAAATPAGTALGEGVIAASAGPCAEEDSGDVRAQIQRFKLRRESRQTRGAVAVMIVAMLIGYVGLRLSSMAKHYGWHNVLSHWGVGYAVSSVGVGLVYVINDVVDFERRFGALDLGDKTTLQWLPVLLAYFYLYSSIPGAMVQKYGWLAAHLYITTYVYPAMLLIVALSKKQINIFVREVTEVPIWKRRPTICEWYTIWAVPCLAMYPVNCVYLWFLGRWEGSRLGPNLSPLLLIICETVVTIEWTLRWGRQSFLREPPEGSKFERKHLLGNLWMQFNIRLGIGSLTFALIGPEQQQQGGMNLDLPTNIGNYFVSHALRLHGTNYE
eukprot:COSAG05_NODE_2939_length_2486_cov_3.528697_1_plen_328_part_00